MWNWMTLGICAALTMALGASLASAAEADLLFEYQSASGQLPVDTGWSYEVECLKASCPFNGSLLDCHFQGNHEANANNCRHGKGCRILGGGGTLAEHYNSPTEVNDGLSGTCHYTEWIMFDDGTSGEDGTRLAYYSGIFLPPPPSLDPSFGDMNVQVYGNRAVPMYGAGGPGASFLGAPTDHPTLRLANGAADGPRATGHALLGHDGVRPKGSTQMRRTLDFTDPEPTAVTLVARLAAGNRGTDHSLLTIRAFHHLLAFGVDGDPSSPEIGAFRAGSTEFTDSTIFPDHKVAVSVAQPVWGPHDGEFFTIRIILRSDGTWTMYLNESTAVVANGTAGPEPAGKNYHDIILNRALRNQSLMWVDWIKAYEAEIPPSNCNTSIRFDVAAPLNEVDENDFVNGLNGFADCATGPAPAVPVGDPNDPENPDPCGCLDINGDGAVDMKDYGVFQRCWSAGTPAIDADPTCDDIETP